MTDIQMVLVTIIGTVYVIFGTIIALVDAQNEKIPTPRVFYADGYNWFGSWTIFLFRIFMTFPFWTLAFIIFLMYKFFMWLFTVKRNKV